MQVEVRLYGVLRKYLPNTRPGEGYKVDLPEGATVADLMSALGMPVDDVNQAFVNGQTVDLAHVLADGDNVRVFSPLGGGSQLAQQPLPH